MSRSWGERLRAWPLRRELSALLVMSLLMVLMGAQISRRASQEKASELERIRALVRDSGALSDAQVGVKMIGQHSLTKDHTLSIYLTIPCAVVCGGRADCARICQSQIATWEPTLHRTSKARYLVELNDQDGALLGYVFRAASGVIRPLDWSLSARLLTVSHRTGEGCCESVLIYAVPPKAGASVSRQLPLKATHALHGLSAFSEDGSQALTVEDQDEDNTPEWLLYDERFANLTPRPLKLKLPYLLSDDGLQLNRRMIRSAPPALNERRSWILKHLKAADPMDGPTPVGLSGPLFTELIRLCVKGHCAEADELAQLAYPQSERAQVYWSQLKAQLSDEP